MNAPRRLTTRQHLRAAHFDDHRIPRGVADIERLHRGMHRMEQRRGWETHTHDDEPREASA